jgi:hypothetical protein
MANHQSFKIFTSSAQLPPDWDTVAKGNIFLSQAYLSVLEQSAPNNMECHFIGLYSNSILRGVALAQYIDLSRIDTFVAKRKKLSVKDYLFKKLSSHIIVAGNNMLTGQNAYLLGEGIDEITALNLIRLAMDDLKRSNKRF